MLDLSFHLIVLIIYLKLLVLIAIFILVGVWKLYYNYRSKKTTKRLNRVMRALHLCLVENKVLKISLTKNDRNAFSRTARSLEGEQLTKLVKMYIKKDFHLMDIDDLYSRSDAEKYEALTRVFHLQIKLEEDIYQELILHNSDANFAALVLKQYIKRYTKKANNTFVKFITENRDVSKGMLFSVIKAYAKTDPEGIPFYLKRITDERILEPLLYAAYLTPAEGMNQSIMRNISVNNSTDVKYLALKTLTHFPDKHTLMLARGLKNDPDWVVRLNVVKLLHAFKFESIKNELRFFLIDFQYHVRLEAVKVCLNMIDEAKDLLLNIYNNEAHPSHQILANELGKIELYGEMR